MLVIILSKDIIVNLNMSTLSTPVSADWRRVLDLWVALTFIKLMLFHS
jgi:hypothetical protein